MKYWEIIADRLSKNGWSWGCSSQIDTNGRTIFTADAHRDDGKRFIVHADEKLARLSNAETKRRSSGEVHVYDATGKMIERKIAIDGRGKYQQTKSAQE